MKKFLLTLFLFAFAAGCAKSHSGTPALTNSASNATLQTNAAPAFKPLSEMTQAERVDTMMNLLSTTWELFNPYAELVRTQSLMKDEVFDKIGKGLKREEYFTSVLKNQTPYGTVDTFMSEFKRISLAFSYAAFDSQLAGTTNTIEGYVARTEDAEKLLAQALADPALTQSKRSALLAQKAQADALLDRLKIFASLKQTLDPALVKAVRRNMNDLTRLYDAMFVSQAGEN